MWLCIRKHSHRATALGWHVIASINFLPILLWQLNCRCALLNMMTYLEEPIGANRPLPVVQSMVQSMVQTVLQTVLQTILWSVYDIPPIDAWMAWFNVVIQWRDSVAWFSGVIQSTMSFITIQYINIRHCRHLFLTLWLDNRSFQLGTLNDTLCTRRDISTLFSLSIIQLSSTFIYSKRYDKHLYDIYFLSTAFTNIYTLYKWYKCIVYNNLKCAVLNTS